VIQTIATKSRVREGSRARSSGEGEASPYLRILSMVENAIKQAITENAKNDKKSKITIEQLLEKATQKEIRICK
jgi:hypothetical protein